MTNLNHVARKITLVLFAAQSLASAGFIAAATINPILGAKLAPYRSLATLPAAAYLLSSAFAAPMWGFLMDRIGRRNAISMGLVIGILGNMLVLAAIQAASFTFVIAGLMLMGVTNSAVQLSRFTAVPQGLTETLALQAGLPQAGPQGLPQIRYMRVQADRVVNLSCNFGA